MKVVFSETMKARNQWNIFKSAGEKNLPKILQPIKISFKNKCEGHYQINKKGENLSR